MAIIGASERNPYSRSALHRVEACGFTGPVYLVNPASSTVFGRPAYPRATDLPGPIDMAFIVVPLVMFVVGCGAALIPALRASKTDPTNAIRHL